jgi:hypothetical protein
LQEADFVCQSLGLARQAPARQYAPVANLCYILWLAARSTFCHSNGYQGHAHYIIQEDKWLLQQEISDREIEEVDTACAFHVETNKIYSTGDKIFNASVQFTENCISWHSLPQLPEAKSTHCIAVLKRESIFDAGGYSKSCFLYDAERNLCKICPDMKISRAFANCWVVHGEVSRPWKRRICCCRRL